MIAGEPQCSPATLCNVTQLSCSLRYDGIDAGNVDRICDAFSTTKPDGMVMGLAVCRSIGEAPTGLPAKRSTTVLVCSTLDLGTIAIINRNVVLISLRNRFT